MVGYDLWTYSFDALAQTITFDWLWTVSIQQVRLITNVTDGIIIYNFASPTKKGTIASNVLTLDYDTTSMSDTDELQIDLVYNNDQDYNLWTLKNSPQSYAPIDSNDSQELVGTATALGSSVDTRTLQGTAFSVERADKLSLLVTHTVSGGAGQEIRVRFSDAIDGTFFAPKDNTGSDISYVMWTTTGPKEFEFDTRRALYARVETKASTLWTDTVTIDIVKTNNG